MTTSWRPRLDPAVHDPGVRACAPTAIRPIASMRGCSFSTRSGSTTTATSTRSRISILVTRTRSSVSAAVRRPGSEPSSRCMPLRAALGCGHGPGRDRVDRSGRSRANPSDLAGRDAAAAGPSAPVGNSDERGPRRSFEHEEAVTNRPFSREELEGIVARAEAATPGPWSAIGARFELLRSRRPEGNRQ
jgi:hypothetical protein